MAGFYSITLAGLEHIGLQEGAVLELRDPPDCFLGTGKLWAIIPNTKSVFGDTVFIHLISKAVIQIVSVNFSFIKPKGLGLEKWLSI